MTGKKARTKGEVLSEYTENATIHGIGRIKKARNIIFSLLWGISLILLASCLIYEAIQLCKKIARYDYNTVISTTLYNTGLSFPAVTICNSNAYPFPRAIALLTKYNPDFGNLTDHNVIYEKFHSIAPNLTMNETDYLGYSFEEMFIPGGCNFKAINCSSKENFKKHLSPDDGNCYIFNHNASLVQSRSGVKFGLTFMFDIQQDTYMSSSKVSNLIPAGVRVTVHDPFRYKNLVDHAIIAAPHQLTRIAVKRRDTVRLQHPYRDNCTNANGLNNGFNYSVHICLSTCNVKEMYKFCGVLDINNYFIARTLLNETLPNAKDQKHIECIKRFEVEFNT